MIWVFIFAYIMIGLIFASALSESDFDGFMLALLFWPIILVFFLMLAVFSVPCWIGSKLRPLLEKLER